MKAILSIDSKGGIGVDSDLAMKNSEDFKHFQNYTSGKTMVCGFGTFHQVSRLHGSKDRKLILCTERTIPNNLKLESGMRVLNYNEIKELNEDLVIIGGKKTYEKFSPLISEVMLTVFKEFNPDSNVFLDPKEVFPHLDKVEVLREEPEFKILKLTKSIL